MRKSIICLLILLSFQITAQINVVPEPKNVSIISSQFFRFPFNIALDVKVDSVEEEKVCEQVLLFFKRYSKVERDSNQPSILVKKITHDKSDYYSLNISQSVLELSYTSNASLLFAFETIKQLEVSLDGDPGLPVCKIEDYPDFEWRGLHLDCARHFFTVDKVKRYIDLMSMYKYNTFHWHLTDDQGWRIEIKKYPKLTEVGAVRNRTIVGHYNNEPRTWDSTRYEGFYTQEDVKEVVAYAKSKSITVVPEIELPGHSRAALAAYPKLSCTDTILPVPGLWGVFEDVYCSDKKTIKFMKNVLDEVVELFPSEYIHIGGDEAPVSRWKECRVCQKNIKKNNLKDEHELQGYFIGEISKHLAKKGRKIIGWDEILDGGLAENSAVMSWRGVNGGIAAANQNHPVVMTPTEFCYFDYYQSDNKEEPLAIGGYLPLKKVYSFNPIPANLDVSKHKYIVGAQANVWTEYITDFQQVEYMTYPRAIALSEKLWNKKSPSYNAFLSKLPYQLELLADKDVHYSKAVYDVELKLTSPEIGVLEVRSETAFSDQIDVVSTRGSLTQGLFGGESLRLYFQPQKSTDLNPIPLTNSVTLEANVRGFEGRKTELDVLLTQNIGLLPVFMTKPYSKFTNAGAFTLVDGVRGQRPWKGSEWLGFAGDTVEIVYDLKEVRELKSTKISCLKAEGSWIYLPNSVDWYFSDDGKVWSAKNAKQINSKLIQLPTIRKTRYIKLVLNPIDVILEGKEGAGQNPWTFIDEIEFIWN